MAVPFLPPLRNWTRCSRFRLCRWPAPLARLGPTESPLPSWMGIYRDLYWDQTQRKVCTPLRQEGWLGYLSMLSRWYRNGLVAMPTPEELALDPLGDAATWVNETLSGNLTQTLVFTATSGYNTDGRDLRLDRHGCRALALDPIGRSADLSGQRAAGYG